MPIYWTDFHSNIHHEQMNQLNTWIEQAKQTMDFWPIAYYPYYMRMDKCGLAVEDTIPEEKIKKDWEVLRMSTEETDVSGFPMFMGYEWQGDGKNGDHNVFFHQNNQNPCFTLDYLSLIQHYDGVEAIGIPHHTAYQIGERGKNWQNQNDVFSPFAEIFSSHGSSECDDTSIAMSRHVHMGPRTDDSTVETGWKQGHHFGVIASGDNHFCPGVYGYGYAAAIADECTKDVLWDAFQKRHVYGVSKDRIQLSFQLDNAMMGDEIEAGTRHLTIKAEGTDAIDRIEILRNNRREALIAGHETELSEGNPLVRFKFFFEAGWGPDIRVFPEITKRSWAGHLHTDGKILSVTPCFGTFGQKIVEQKEHDFSFELTTHAGNTSGKWMGAVQASTEGFVFEIEDYMDSSIHMEIEGKIIDIPIRRLLNGTQVFSMDQEVKDLLKGKYQFTEYYRSDPWWHNAYKFRLCKAALQSSYTIEHNCDLAVNSKDVIRCRIWQKNGSCAWTSPIFVK